jgi:DhnA family fructose-bisphosphate aldolase class Ia
LHSLVSYAKKIRNELEDYKTKVEMSEKIVKDLMSTGNDSVGSLLGMLKKYKRSQKNAEEEIVKFKELDLIKENELVTLNQELEVLHQVQTQEVYNFEQRFKNGTKSVEENRNIIKRQDKLIVDLQ